MLYVMMVIDEPSKGKWKERIQENEFLFNYIITKFYRNKKDKNIERFITNLFGDWGLGIGDWGLGIGDWGLGPIPNPQSPIPNPQSPYNCFLFVYMYIHLLI